MPSALHIVSLVLFTWAAGLGLAACSSTAAEPERNGFRLTPSSIPESEFLAGGPPRDGIPALDHPRFDSATATAWEDETRVLAVSIAGDARAYPLAILDWHELVNDTVGGRPILVSYCPLCGTGMVFDRRVDGTARSFGVSGLLYRSDLLLYDRETESLWSQVLAEAVTGPALGTRLELMRTQMTRWGAWRKRHPHSRILSPDTGYRRPYDRSPYGDYARSDRLVFPVHLDRRYPPKTWTVGLRQVGNDGVRARAYPVTEIERAGGEVQDRFAGAAVRISLDRSVGSYEVEVPEAIEVIEGYWFAWAAFHPETSVFVATDPSE